MTTEDGTVLRLGGLPPLPSQNADVSTVCHLGDHDRCDGYTEQQNNDPTDVDTCLCLCHDLMEEAIRYV